MNGIFSEVTAAANRNRMDTDPQKSVKTIHEIDMFLGPK